jgi:hypothetical protein
MSRLQKGRQWTPDCQKRRALVQRDHRQKQDVSQYAGPCTAVDIQASLRHCTARRAPGLVMAMNGCAPVLATAITSPGSDTPDFARARFAQYPVVWYPSP